MKNKIIVLSSVAICVILIVIGVTSAYFTSEDSVVNIFNTGSINAIPEEIVNGTTKEVWVKNTGDNDCLVRVIITPRWVDENGNPWAGDVNMVNLNFNTSNIIDSNTSSDWEEAKWIKGNDEYYYYTSILPVYSKNGEIESGVTSKLLSSVDLKNGITDEYKNKTLKIDVKVESVQSTQSAYSTVWNMTSAGDNISKLLTSITSTN